MVAEAVAMTEAKAVKESAENFILCMCKESSDLVKEEVEK